MLVLVLGLAWIKVSQHEAHPITLQCTEPQVIRYTFHAKRIERDDSTYIITAKDGTVIRFEKSAYAYCLAVPDKEEK